jgi:hypothetical protein
MTPATTPRTALLRTLAIFLLFAVLASPLARIHPYKPPTIEALQTHDDVELAILGDSRPHAGVSPTILAEAFSSAGLGARRGYNFGQDGSDALHHVSFGRELLRRAASLRLVVWSPNPLSFDDTRRSNRLEQLATSDIVPLARAGAPLELLLDLATGAAFPPYQKRPLVKERVEGRTTSAANHLLPFQTKVLGLQYEPRPKPREYFPLPDGQEPFTVIADWQDRFDRGGAQYQIDYERLQLSEWHFRYARELLAQARKAGVLVVVVELPVAPSYRERFASLPKHAAWRQRLATLAAEEGALWFSDADAYGDDRQFGDPGHMHREAAAAYSKRLGDLLAREPRVRAAFADR